MNDGQFQQHHPIWWAEQQANRRYYGTAPYGPQHGMRIATLGPRQKVPDVWVADVPGCRVGMVAALHSEVFFVSHAGHAHNHSATFPLPRDEWRFEFELQQCRCTVAQMRRCGFLTQPDDGHEPCLTCAGRGGTWGQPAARLDEPGRHAWLCSRRNKARRARCPRAQLRQQQQQHQDSGRVPTTHEP